MTARLSAQAQTVLPRLIEGTVWAAIFVEPDFPIRKQEMAYRLVGGLAKSLGFSNPFFATVVRSGGNVQHGALIFDMDETHARFVAETLGNVGAVIHSDASHVRVLTMGSNKGTEMTMKCSAKPIVEKPYFSVYEAPSDDPDELGRFICACSFQSKKGGV